MTDSSISAPSKPSIFSSSVSYLLDTRKDAMFLIKKDKGQNIFLVYSRLSNDDIEMSRGPIFNERRPGAGFKNGLFFRS